MISQRKLLAALAATMLACGIGSAHAQDCANESALRSASRGAPVELSFRNASDEGRRLYWLDQNGNRKFISVVRPGTIYSQPTAATHSWVVTDEAEKCLYAVTATTEPQTIDVSGQTVAQITPPGTGSQEPIVAAPARSVSPPPSAEPAQIAAAAPEAGQAVADLASDAGGEDVQVEVPQVSPIEQFSLTGNVRVLAVAEEGKSLNNQASGTVEVVRVNPEWDSGQWSFEPVSGSPFVRIKNNWKRTYLADVNGQLKAVAALADADPSHWSVEPVDGTAYVQLRNRESDRFLLNVNGAPNLVSDYRQDQERQSYWQVNPATDAVAVSAPRIAALSAYNSAVTDCRDIGGVWTGSSCRSNYAVMGYGVAQPLACPRGWFWDQQAGECLYEVASSGPACPPWQIGSGGQCVSDLTCRGGTLRNSRRGASCNCPFGMAPWGNYPNLSCKPSVARIVPLLLLSKLGGSLHTKQHGPRLALGQAYGNKQFGKNPQTNANNGNKLIIKVSKPVTTPPNLGPTNASTTTKPVVINPVVTNPVVTNPNAAKPTGNNAGGTNPVGLLTNPTNPVTGNTPPSTNTGAKTTTTANPNVGVDKAVADFNKLTPQQKTQAIDACKNDNGPGCSAIKQAVGLQTGTNTNVDPSKGKPSTGQPVIEADAKTKADAAAKLKADADAKTKADAAAKLRADADAKTKADAAAKLRADADAKAKADAANKLKIEADNKAKIDAANKAKIEAANKAKIDAANQAKINAANQAKINAANQARINAANQARINAANQARINAANQARINAANQARINAANQARVNAANQARITAARPAPRPSNGPSGCPAGKRRLPNGACG